MSIKKCSKCFEEKPVSEFFKSGKYLSGKPKIRGDCKSCASKDTTSWRKKNRSHYNNYTAFWRAKNPDRHHATEIKRRYGLGVETYLNMLADQNYGCAICGKKHDTTKKKGRLHVDHCHQSNKIRGLLCGGCNSAIGYLNDEIGLFKKAIEYISKF